MTTSFLPAKEWGWSQQANSQILDSGRPRKQARGACGSTVISTDRIKLETLWARAGVAVVTETCSRSLQDTRQNLLSH